MYSKFIKLIVLLSLLVCCGFAGRVLYGRFPQLCRTRERSTSHFSFQLYGVRCQVKPFKCNQIEKGKLLIIKNGVLGTN